MERGKKRDPRNWFGSCGATNRPGVVDRVIGARDLILLDGV
jgi:hypothetical protein